MSNLSRLEFTALDVSGRNYLTWVQDAELHLISQNLGETIIPGNSASQQDYAKAMIMLRHHLHESLKAQYLTVKSPSELWTSLKERYEHQKTVILPRARYEWMHLRLQDFKKVLDYNSEIHRIASKLKLCGENIQDADMLEKTFSTFHASNLVLQQQYRERGFKTFSELISSLLLAEENNQLLMNNHEKRPTGSAPLPDNNQGTPEANATSSRRGRGRGGRGRGHGRGYDQGRNPTWVNPDIQKNNGNKSKKQHDKPTPKAESLCHRCGAPGHWVRTCRTSPHLVKLYQDFAKSKGKGVVTNFVEGEGPDDSFFDGLEDAYLETSDFLPRDGNDKISPMLERNVVDLPNDVADLPNDRTTLFD